MARYVHKPIEVEAAPLDAVLAPDRPDWIKAALADGRLFVAGPDNVVVTTTTGLRVARPGDWLLRYADGDLAISAGAVFSQMWTRVDE